jgi:hypothetical protein
VRNTLEITMACFVWQRQGLTWDQICRRASVRRKWNERRQEQARQRRDYLLHLWLESDVAWGWQSQLAVALGVHRSTVCRDLKRLLAPWDV